MARKIFGGFEIGDSSDGALGAVNGTVTAQGTVKRSGSFAGRCDSGGSNLAAFITVDTLAASVASRSYFYRTYRCFGALPASTVKIIATFE
jgi:hypothetical protein